MSILPTPRKAATSAATTAASARGAGAVRKTASKAVKPAAAPAKKAAVKAAKPGAVRKPSPSVDASDMAVDDSVAERILSAIRDDIIAGQLTPGTSLVEVDLAARFGVSRNSLREAFRLLCRDGLAVHQRHRGVMVRTLTRADVRDIFRARRTLELSAVTRTDPVDAGLLAEMADAVTRQETAAAADRWQDVGTASLQFHQCIVRLHGSSLLDGFFRNLIAQLRLLFASAPEERVIQKPWVPKDRALYELLEACLFDDATRQLADYLATSEHALLDYL